MSVRKTTNGYVVRWREGTRNRSRRFDRKADAQRWDDETRRRRQLGTLDTLTAATLTLDDFATERWAPVYGRLLAPRTRRIYGWVYDRHIGPTLGHLPLHKLTPGVLMRWQLVAHEAGPEAGAKARTVLSALLSAAVQEGLLAGNPLRSVRAPKAPLRDEVRPLAPAAVEALRAQLDQRDATLVSTMAYAGLRPGEARQLRWGHIGERTIVVNASKTGRRRSVRLLDPLRRDLAEWRLASGRPPDDAPVFPRPSDGGEMSDRSFDDWRAHSFVPALERAGLPRARPYDLRHSFASLLLHEGRSVVYVARQLGHAATLTLNVYGHVVDELDEAPHVAAEDAIRAARTAAPLRRAVGS